MTVLCRDAEEMFGAAATLSEATCRKARKPLVGLNHSNAMHAARTDIDKRDKAENLEEALAFLADRSSQWSRIYTMNERRGKR